MLRAMHTSASGMRAQEFNLDTTANNLANVNTVGFKRARADFEDVLYQTVTPPTQGTGDQSGHPVGLEVGHGARITDTERIFTQGDTETTDNPLDVLIQGQGFFVVRDVDGTDAYSRNGSFKLDADRRLVDGNGHLLQPEITLPNDTTGVNITSDGRVVVSQAGQTTTAELGQILLATFPNPAGLTGEGGNLLKQSDASGDAVIGAPGDAGAGTILQGALEHSNVQVVDEMVNLIVAQRAFEMNSKAIRTADDMMQTSVNIRPA